MNLTDCVIVQDFARCESEMPRGAKKYEFGFSIRSFTRFPCPKNTPKFRPVGRRALTEVKIAPIPLCQYVSVVST